MRPRLAYLALWAIAAGLLLLGTILASTGTASVADVVNQDNGVTTYVSREIPVGGWGVGFLILGAVTVLVLLFLDSYRGAPQRRERSDRPGIDSEV
jgi:hypothetical protein